MTTTPRTTSRPVLLSRSTRLLAHGPIAGMRGFTLVEILISMMFFSLGIMGIIAFFFLGVRDAREAERRTTSAFIARDVREALSQAMRYPVLIEDSEADDGYRRMYRFELPTIAEYSPENPNPENNRIVFAQSALNGKRMLDRIDGFYFMIGSEVDEVAGNDELVLTEMPTNNTINKALDASVLDLPYEAFYDPEEPDASIAQQVFWVGDRYKEYRPEEDGDLYDADVRHFYSFRILIKRGQSASGVAEGPLKAGDLLNCTVYIYRGYNVGDDAEGVPNPYQLAGIDFDNHYEPMTGDALFVDNDDEPLVGVDPVATYHFMLSGN